MARHKLILITPGDPAGIGPEIVWKTLCAKAGKRPFTHRFKGFKFVCVGSRAPFEKLGAHITEVTERQLRARDLPHAPLLLLAAPTCAPRSSLLLEGYQAGWAIETATRLIQSQAAHALVTGPISKERLQRGGFPYSGHTDFLADLCHVKHVTMMLANEQLRISLVTVHIGIKDVPSAMTRKGIRTTVLHTVESLQNWWGIKKPRIGVAALNPHAGEGGLFGDEEIRIISPEILALRKLGLQHGFTIDGPLPADTLFAQHISAKPKSRYDAVICMYHDQGLIPVKLLDFPRTVNVTLGLPIVRTSVDHGVAFDIAGQNQADPSSLQSAMKLAVEIVGNQRKRK